MNFRLLIICAMAVIIITDVAYSQNDRIGEPKNHIGLFIGGETGTFAGGETSFIIGLDYEYMLNTTPLFGIGAIMDINFAENTEYIFGLPIYIHPYKELKLWAAPSIISAEFTEEIDIDPNSPNYENYSRADLRFFLRFGAGYDFIVNSYVFTPMIEADVISSQLILGYGIIFGIRF